jgi:hypothetical protein
MLTHRQAIDYLVTSMKRFYKRWMHSWEERMTTRDTNRVVRPFEWGYEWTRKFPGADRLAWGESFEQQFDYFAQLNRYIVEHSDEFFAYKTPADFRLEQRRVQVFFTGSGEPPKDPDETGTYLRFTSPHPSPFPENNAFNARWFPPPQHGRRSLAGGPGSARGKRAVIVLPQWNADGISHNGFARIFNPMGIAVLRMSKPYHDIRRPEGLHRADYAVSSNIGRTIHAARQGITDVRAALDWLESEGYSDFGILGTSLGSCYAFIASAHDERLRINVFNHASTYFGDVVWTGQSTRHVRQGIEEASLDMESLRKVWLGISPMAFFDKFSRWPKKSLMIYGEYDLTFLPEFSLQIADEFRRRKLDTIVKALPCGHYSLGETPYKYMDAWHISRFLRRAFGAHMQTQHAAI